MSRPLPTGLVALLRQTKIPLAFLAEIDWPGGTVYVWTGYFTLNWNSIDWAGIGHLGQISDIDESGDQTANGLTLSLSGIPTANVAEILKNDTQSRPGRVYMGVLATNGFAIDPVCIFDGVIDQPVFTNDGKTASISINLEKEMIDNRSAASRYTPEDQKRKYPTDLGLDFVPGLATKTFTWGKATVYPVGGGGGGGSGDGSIDMAN